MDDKSVVDIFNFAFWPIFYSAIILALTGNFGLSIAAFVFIAVAGWQVD